MRDDLQDPELLHKAELVCNWHVCWGTYREGKGVCFVLNICVHGLLNNDLHNTGSDTQRDYH